MIRIKLVNGGEQCAGLLIQRRRNCSKCCNAGAVSPIFNAIDGLSINTNRERKITLRQTPTPAKVSNGATEFCFDTARLAIHNSHFDTAP